MVYAVAKRGFGAGTGNWAALLVGIDAVSDLSRARAANVHAVRVWRLDLCVWSDGIGIVGFHPSNGFRRQDMAREKTNRIPFKAIGFIAVGTAIALYAHNLAFVTCLAGNIYLFLQALLKRQPWRKEWELIAGQAARGDIVFAVAVLCADAAGENSDRVLDAGSGLAGCGANDACIYDLSAITAALDRDGARRFDPGLGFCDMAVDPTGADGKASRARGCWARLRWFRHCCCLFFPMSFAPCLCRAGRLCLRWCMRFCWRCWLHARRAGYKLVWGWRSLDWAAVLLPFYYSAFGEWRRAPYVEADAFLRAQATNGDVILHDNKLAFFPMHLYDRTLPQVFLADPPQSDNDTLAPASQAAMELFPIEFDKAVAGQQRVWFVIYRTAIEEAADAGIPHANLARLDGQISARAGNGLWRPGHHCSMQAR